MILNNKQHKINKTPRFKNIFNANCSFRKIELKNTLLLFKMKLYENSN